MYFTNEMLRLQNLHRILIRNDVSPLRAQMQFKFNRMGNFIHK